MDGKDNKMIDAAFPLVNPKSGKRYALGEYEGKRARFYPSGMILDDETGRPMRGPGRRQAKSICTRC